MANDPLRILALLLLVKRLLMQLINKEDDYYGNDTAIHELHVYLYQKKGTIITISTYDRHSGAKDI